jgi:uncharacterized damage-inducible protein DinB
MHFGRNFAMDSIQLIRRLHQHRAWATSNLLTAVSKLTDEQRHRQFAIGQGSLWKSLVHMYGAEYVWLEGLKGNETAVLPGDLPGKIPGNQEGQGALTGMDDLKQKWSEQEKRWSDYLATLKPESLDQLIYRKRPNGDRLSIRTVDALLHVCTHAHYTTAQVVNMLRQTGVEPLPEIMLVMMARQELQAATN